MMKAIVAIFLLLQATLVSASKRTSQENNLAKYLARVQMTEGTAPERTSGSLWIDSGRMAALATDYKARQLGDLITVVVVQGVTATSTGAVSTDRSFKASSGVDSLPGKLKTTGIANLLGVNSAETLSGKGQASSTSTLRTSL